MKIGILTFHYAHNCGACLQAFALKTYLKKKGQDAQLINYKNPVINNLYPKKHKVKISFGDFVHLDALIKKIKLIRDYRYGQHEWREQHKKFEMFINKFLLDGDYNVLNSEQVKNLDIDLFIAGSDQIWNKQLTGGYDDIYLLNFVTKARKAYYGASNGTSEIESHDLPVFNDVFLGTNKYISTREPNLAAFLSKTFNRDVLSVVDPCFLLGKEDYINIFSLNERKYVPNKKYIFGYFISERNKRAREVVSMIAHALNLEIFEFHYRKSRDLKHDYQTCNIGPIEFLNLIHHAEFVVTDSFHGTVFSIIFNKKFYSFYKEDVRKNNLLEKLNLTERHIRDFKDVDLNKDVDFSNVNLDEYSLTSKKFLNEMIEEYENDTFGK